MKYWDEGEKKMIKVPKGAGFTSGALVRPIAPSNKQTKTVSNIKGVPIKTAHAILNRCKEIILTGSVDYSVERSNTTCDGPTSSTKTWTSESGPNGCPPGTCKDTSGSITIECVSQKQTTTMGISGSINMTAYRYRQLSDIWNNPTPLDLSLNYFYGNVENKALLRKMSFPYCIPLSSGVTGAPLPSIEVIAEYDKQTKLSSACLVYPESNNSILSATHEENLKKITLSATNCDKSSEIAYGLGADPFDLEALRYPDGVFRFFNTNEVYLAPTSHTGPSLGCRFYNNGWDFGTLGSESPEAYYTNDCKPYKQNFPNYKMTWKSTGIKKTISGSCGLNFDGVGRYDTDEAEECKCDSECTSCTPNYGTLKLVCDCQPRCIPEPVIVDDRVVETNPCKGERKADCDAIWGLGFSIAKYYAVNTAVAAVPLSAKAETKTEDLSIFGSGYIIDEPSAASFGIPIYFVEPGKPSDTSITKYESKEIGTLTLKCEGWETEIPLWTIFTITKATTCAGFSSGYGFNIFNRSVKSTPTVFCAGCTDDDEDRCCAAGGCGGIEGEQKCCESQYCGIDDPCGYAFKTTNVGGECEGNKSTTCAGSCEFSTGEDCGCCGCVIDEEDEYCDVVCPPFKKCAPYKLIKDFSESGLGCYGDAYQEDIHKATVDLTLEFKLFTEME
jgi:hypothetical protein